MSNRIEPPQVGFGVFRIPRSQTSEMVRVALEVGYRHIDTAQAYGNEAEVGQAVASSGLPREQVFLTTKLHPHEHGFDSTIVALEESLRKLRTPYVDLFLLHWPSPPRETYLESWRACERLRAAGKVRSIGVSNLNIGHLKWLAECTDIVPAVNQIELHPHVQQRESRQYHQAHGIRTEAWSPIAQGRSLRDPALRAIADKHGRTAAQVALRWHLQLGNVALSKSATPSRVEENFSIFGFELDAEDMAKVARLDGDPGGAPSQTIEAGLPSWH